MGLSVLACSSGGVTSNESGSATGGLGAGSGGLSADAGSSSSGAPNGGSGANGGATAGGTRDDAGSASVSGGAEAGASTGGSNSEGGDRALGGSSGSGGALGGSSGNGGALGGSSGTGGTSGGAFGGSSGSGGASGGAAGARASGGTGGCFCPATACPGSAIRLQVSAPQNGVIGSKVEGTSVHMRCLRSGCAFVCESQEAALADGDYAVTVSVPGYQNQTVQVRITNPTQCGCCGCCPFSASQNVTLTPDGTPITGCCSDLSTDPNNCGACGHTCASGAWCASGQCTPLYSNCVGPNDGFATCDSYCKSLGKSCQKACGPSGTEAIHWWGQGSVNCSDNIYSSNGACSDPLTGFTGARCCCAG